MKGLQKTTLAKIAFVEKVAKDSKLTTETIHKMVKKHFKSGMDLGFLCRAMKTARGEEQLPPRGAIKTATKRPTKHVAEMSVGTKKVTDAEVMAEAAELYSLMKQGESKLVIEVSSAGLRMV
jgi:hypothetical protein